ncbi:MAG: hypothetical protein R3B39_02520 [Candidatus Paceibacterota bacterium]
MNKKLKKFIKMLKMISLSEKEKDTLRYRIEQFISYNPIRSEVHVPKKTFYFSIFTFKALGKAVSLVLIALIVVGGSGVSYASTDSLPGDKLYNVKINVNEKIEEKLAFSTEAKVVVQRQQVERRLTEAQKLVEKKDLSPEKKEIVKTNLEKNVKDVTESIENLKKEGKIEEALDTTSKITPVLEAHKKVLTEQKTEEDKKENSSEITAKMSVALDSKVEEKDALLDTVEEAIRKVEKAEKEIIEEVNENEKTAEEVAEKNTKEVSEKIEILKKENDESSKEEVEIKEESNQEVSLSLEKDLTLVNSTATTTSGNVEKSAIKISSETDAKLKVKEAESLLVQAEAAKKSGNFKQALLLSQQAKKIIAQIEEYQKIKQADLSSEESTSKSESTKTEVAPVTKEPATEVEVKEEIKTEVPVVDIKAEAIKSLEETNASLKKINFIQSTQNRLLP